MSKILPVRCKHPGGESEAQDHVDEDTGREREERSWPDPRQLTGARRQSDAEEAEDECPGSEVLERRDELRRNRIVIRRLTKMGRDGGNQSGGREESQDELWEAPPDLRNVGL